VGLIIWDEGDRGGERRFFSEPKKVEDLRQVVEEKSALSFVFLAARR
jgi:hypothetical protein